MRKLCPKCGGITEKFYENLCKDCFLSRIIFTNLIPEKIILRKCKICERFFLNDKPTSINEIVGNLLKILKLKNLESVNYRIVDKELYVTLHLKIYDLKKSEQKVCKLAERLITCKFCLMKEVGYYQAVIQVRSETKIFDEILEKMKSQVENLKRHDELAFISKITKNDFLDVYLGSVSTALKVVNKLKRLYGGEIKITKKLVGVKGGKRMYRTTILLRI